MSHLFEHDGLADAAILHYHDCMQPQHWPALLARLEGTHPEVHAWLGAEPPLSDPAPRGARMLREALRIARGLPRRRYRTQMQLSLAR